MSGPSAASSPVICSKRARYAGSSTVSVLERKTSVSTSLRSPLSLSSMSRKPVADSGEYPHAKSWSVVVADGSRAPVATIPRTSTIAQTAIVRHGCEALARASPSVVRFTVTVVAPVYLPLILSDGGPLSLLGGRLLIPVGGGLLPPMAGRLLLFRRATAARPSRRGQACCRPRPKVLAFPQTCGRNAGEDHQSRRRMSDDGTVSLSAKRGMRRGTWRRTQRRHHCLRMSRPIR
jgi:hypothetical protein